MDVNSDSKLEYKDIKNSLSKLNSRQLYILVYEMYLNNIDIVVNDNLDYLINRIQILGWNALQLNNYIEMCIILVIENKYMGWLEKNLRTAIWFDKYWSNYRDRVGIEKFSLYADFETDFLKSFDACRLLSERAHTEKSLSIQKELIDKKISSPPSETIPLCKSWKRITQMEPESRQSELKIAFITSARKAYIRDSANKKDLKWLNSNDELQIDWAIGYLESRELLIKPYLFIPSNSIDCYHQICASIDAFVILRDSLKRNNDLVTLNQKDFIIVMRNAWYQQKSRGKPVPKVTKQSLLTLQYKKKLEKLCNSYGVDSYTYLENLIDNEIDKL